MENQEGEDEMSKINKLWFITKNLYKISNLVISWYGRMRVGVFVMIFASELGAEPFMITIIFLWSIWPIIRFMYFEIRDLYLINYNRNREGYQ